MVLRTVQLLVATLLLASPVLAGEWNVDPSHSAVNFKIRHMMLSNVNGKFKDYKIALTTDDKDKVTLVDATIDAKSIDTSEQKRDDHLRGKDFFDTEANPNITFKSKKIVPSKEKGAVKIVGELTMHGVTKEVTFNGNVTPAIKDPYGNQRRGLSATAKVNRKDFGIVWNSPMEGGGVVVGDTVDVNLELEFTAAKKDDAKKS